MNLLDLSLLLFADWDKVLGHVAHVHHARSVLEHIVLHSNFLGNSAQRNMKTIHLLLLSEAKNVKGFVGKLHVLAVVDGGHSDLALRHVPVVHDVVGQQALLLVESISIISLSYIYIITNTFKSLTSSDMRL